MLAALLITPFAGIAYSSLAITDSQNQVYQGRTLELSESLPGYPPIFNGGNKQNQAICCIDVEPCFKQPVQLRTLYINQ